MQRPSQRWTCGDYGDGGDLWTRNGEDDAAAVNDGQGAQQRLHVVGQAEEDRAGEQGSWTVRISDILNELNWFNNWFLGQKFYSNEVASFNMVP